MFGGIELCGGIELFGRRELYRGVVLFTRDVSQTRDFEDVARGGVRGNNLCVDEPLMPRQSGLLK